MKHYLILVLAFLTITAACLGEDTPPDNKHGVMVRVAQIYINPDPNSAKLGEVTRGREVIILDQSREWVRVLASVTAEKDLNGWILDKGVIRPDTPDGDRILFGEGAASELIATQRNGRKGAADDARRLYYRTYEYFPKSPLAGEALYRAADILWQVQAADVKSRASANKRDPFLHGEYDDEYMKLVIKKFPGTKWADLAAFQLLDPKLCGDWEGEPKCPEKESEMYDKYATEHPNSPSAPEALYKSAWRQAALIEIYKTQNKQKQSDDARARAKSTAQLAISKYPQSDWAYRCRALVYMVETGIPTWGTATE